MPLVSDGVQHPTHGLQDSLTFQTWYLERIDHVNGMVIGRNRTVTAVVRAVFCHAAVASVHGVL